MILIEYLRIMTAGVASRVWRTLAGRPCPCDSCTAHAAFVRDTEAAYDAEVLRGGEFACVTCGAREARTWPSECPTCAARPRAFLPTLDEAHERRHR